MRCSIPSAATREHATKIVASSTDGDTDTDTDMHPCSGNGCNTQAYDNSEPVYGTRNQKADMSLQQQRQQQQRQQQQQQKHPGKLLRLGPFKLDDGAVFDVKNANGNVVDFGSSAEEAAAYHKEYDEWVKRADPNNFKAPNVAPNTAATRVHRVKLDVSGSSIHEAKQEWLQKVAPNLSRFFCGGEPAKPCLHERFQMTVMHMLWPERAGACEYYLKRWNACKDKRPGTAMRFIAEILQFIEESTDALTQLEMFTEVDAERVTDDERRLAIEGRPAGNNWIGKAKGALTKVADVGKDAVTYSAALLGADSFLDGWKEGRTSDAKAFKSRITKATTVAELHDIRRDMPAVLLANVQSDAARVLASGGAAWKGHGGELSLGAQTGVSSRVLSLIGYVIADAKTMLDAKLSGRYRRRACLRLVAQLGIFALGVICATAPASFGLGLMACPLALLGSVVVGLMIAKQRKDNAAAADYDTTDAPELLYDTARSEAADRFCLLFQLVLFYPDLQKDVRAVYGSNAAAAAAATRGGNGGDPSSIDGYLKSIDADLSKGVTAHVSISDGSSKAPPKASINAADATPDRQWTEFLARVITGETSSDDMFILVKQTMSANDARKQEPTRLQLQSWYSSLGSDFGVIQWDLQAHNRGDSTGLLELVIDYGRRCAEARSILVTIDDDDWRAAGGKVAASANRANRANSANSADSANSASVGGAGGSGAAGAPSWIATDREVKHANGKTYRLWRSASDAAVTAVRRVGPSRGGKRVASYEVFVVPQQSEGRKARRKAAGLVGRR